MSRLHTIGILVTGCICVALVTHGTNEHRARQERWSVIGDLRARELARIAARNMGSIHTLSVAYSVTQDILREPGSFKLASSAVVPPQWYAEIKAQLTTTNDADGSFLLRRRTRLPEEDCLGPELMLSWDMESQRTVAYIPDSSSASVFLGPAPIRLADEHEVLLAGRLFRPIVNGNGYDDGSIISFLRNSSVRADKEVANGFVCDVADVRVAGSLLATIWVSPDHGCIPIRMIEYDASMAVQFQTDVLEVRSFDAGGGVAVWLPLYVVTTGRVLGFEIGKVIVVDAESTSVNQVFLPGDLAIPLSEGTRVADATGGDGVVKAGIVVDGEVRKIDGVPRLDDQR